MSDAIRLKPGSILANPLLADWDIAEAIEEDEAYWDEPREGESQFPSSGGARLFVFTSAATEDFVKEVELLRPRVSAVNAAASMRSVFSLSTSCLLSGMFAAAGGFAFLFPSLPHPLYWWSLAITCAGTALAELVKCHRHFAKSA